MVGDFGGDGSGRDEVGSRERGEEVIEGVFVGEVDDGDRGGESPLVGLFAAEEVVFAEGEVEEIARIDAGWGFDRRSRCWVRAG